MLDFSLNSYLTTLNLIHKYKLKSVLEKPKLNSVELVLNLKQKNINHFEIIKLYIIFYITFNAKPFFKIKVYNTIENKLKNNTNTKIIRILLKNLYINKNCIEEFLNNFPINTVQKPLYFKYNWRKSTKNLKRTQRKDFSCNSTIPLSRWINCFTYQKIFNLLSIELKDLLIDIKFNFSTHLQQNLNLKRLVLNTLAFWKILRRLKAN